MEEIDRIYCPLCVYCNTHAPEVRTVAEAEQWCRDHLERCVDHPLAEARREIARLRAVNEALTSRLAEKS